MVQSSTLIAPPVQGRRSSARLRLGIPARLQLFGGNRSCLLVDISRCGGKIGVAEPPAVGSGGILTCEELDVFCVVVWSTSDQCGLHFDELLSQQMLLKMRTIVDNYPALEREKQSRHARDWVAGTISIY